MLMESGMIDSLHEENIEVDQLPLMVPIIDEYIHTFNDPSSLASSVSSSWMSPPKKKRPSRNHHQHSSNRLVYSNDDFTDGDVDADNNSASGGSDSEEILEMTDTDHSSARMSFISHMSSPTAASPLFQSTPPDYSDNSRDSPNSYQQIHNQMFHQLSLEEEDIETMIATPNKHFPRHYYRHSVMDVPQQNYQQQQLYIHQQQQQSTKQNKYNTAVGYNESKNKQQKQYNDHYRNDYFGFVAPPSTPTTPKKSSGKIRDQEYSDYDSDSYMSDDDEEKYKFIRKQAKKQEQEQQQQQQQQQKQQSGGRSMNYIRKYGGNNSINHSNSNSRNDSLSNFKQIVNNNNNNNGFDYRKPEEFQKLLSRIKDNSMYCGSQFNELVSKVKVINHSMNHIMAQNFELYSKTCNDVLGETYRSMESMKTLINSMELLNSDLFQMYKLASQIKHVKKSLDLLDIYVSRLPSLAEEEED